MMELVKERNGYLSDFLESEKKASGEPGWLATLRRDAMSQFSTLGFPTLKQEAWRFTNVAPVARTRFEQPAEPASLDSSVLDREFAALDCPRIVFVDGHFSSSLTQLGELQPAVRVLPLSKAVREKSEDLEKHYGRMVSFHDHAFAALNTAFASDGAYVEVARGTVVEHPIHLLFLTTDSEKPVRVHPRNLVVVGESCQFNLVESYLGLADNVYLSNPVTEVLVGDNSIVDHYRLQQESRKAFHFGINQVKQGRDTNYRTTAIDLGGLITRNDLTCVLDGEGSVAGLNGLYLLNGEQHVDNYTTLEHRKPHCDSRELFKGILDGKAKGIFRGRIIVHKPAQKTDSKQTNQNLLLSDDAYVNTKPQLEIYADDVKCTHGATIGQLDATGLFYLRSRGISEKAARSILIYAFASEVIDKIRIGHMRDPLVRFFIEWLPKGDLVKEVYQQ